MPIKSGWCKRDCRCAFVGMSMGRRKHVCYIKDDKELAIDVSTCGPRKAAKLLCQALTNPRHRADWSAVARVRAITDSIMGSKESALSGMRAWVAFHKNCLGRQGLPFPPALGDLVAWSELFRHPGTFGNYVSYLKVACELVEVPLEVFGHPSIKRAKNAIAKRRLYSPRKPLFIRLELVQRIVTHVLSQPEQRTLAMLILAAYTFLLRLPSEALPMAVHDHTGSKPVPVLKVHAGMVELWRPKRKNKLSPSTQWRPCWCRKWPNILGAYLKQLQRGAQPFIGISPGQALVGLKNVLAAMGVANASEYRTHDCRRGHAEDLRVNGATLGEILRAGDWKSLFLLLYLDVEQLEMDRVAEAHDLYGSSDEEDGMRCCV